MSLSVNSHALIQLALREDIGRGDLTTKALIAPEFQAGAIILARETFVLCGHEVVREVFDLVDASLRYEVKLEDGSRVKEGDILATVRGSYASILTAERTALNFLQQLSGVATATARIVERVHGTSVKVLDTRKTRPGWRELEKYAVRVGGGTNHRMGLYDAVLIKNNHIDAIGGEVSLAVNKAREISPQGTKIEVEVRNFHELELALSAKPDAVLLDNMYPEMLGRAVSLRNDLGLQHIEFEASGGINEDNVADFAETGVDSISFGAITHHAVAVDISLRFTETSRQTSA